MNPDSDDLLRDPALTRLFHPGRLPLPPLGLVRRVVGIPARYPRLHMEPRFNRAPLWAGAGFLLALVAVLLMYGGLDTMAHLLVNVDVEPAWSLLKANRELLPSPSRSGLWLAVLCAGTLLSLGVLAGGVSEGTRLRRD